MQNKNPENEEGTSVKRAFRTQSLIYVKSMNVANLIIRRNASGSIESGIPREREFSEHGKQETATASPYGRCDSCGKDDVCLPHNGYCFACCAHFEELTKIVLRDERRAKGGDE